MSSDPYKTPLSDVTLTEYFPQRPVRGIITGLLVDIGGTIITSLIIVFTYGIILGITGRSVEEIERLTTNYDPLSPIGIVASVFGLIMSYIAGYVCAKVSRARNLRYPTILATIIFILGTLVSWGGIDIFLLLVMGLVGFAVTLLGAIRYINNIRLARTLLM